MDKYLDNKQNINNLFKFIDTNYNFIHVKLTAKVIEQLPVISGNDSYTLYNLEALSLKKRGDMNRERELLEFNHLNEKIYYLIRDNILFKTG